MRYSKVFPRLQMIFQDLPDHHFLLCLSSLQSPNGSRRVPRHRGTLATGFGWQHSEFTHLSGDIPWVTYTLYIYIIIIILIYIYIYITWIIHPLFFPFTGRRPGVDHEQSRSEGRDLGGHLFVVRAGWRRRLEMTGDVVVFSVGKTCFLWLNRYRYRYSHNVTI